MVARKLVPFLVASLSEEGKVVKERKGVGGGWGAVVGKALKGEAAQTFLGISCFFELLQLSCIEYCQL